MKTEFFPKNIQFWLYHLSVLAGLTLYEFGVITTFTSGEELVFNISGWLLNIFIFTLVALLFRKIYFIQQWKYYSIPKLTLWVVLFSCTAALIGEAVVQTIQVIIYWKHFSDPEYTNRFYNAPIVGIYDIYLKSAVTFSEILCLWIFIYISVKTIRNTRKAEITNLKLENSLKEARLNSLSNQLNPHFLFNALNNIRFMIHENSIHADKMVTSLSDILRYSLESNKKEKVSLRQEMEIIDRYIDIVKTQLENRLTFKMDIPDSFRDYLLPPMTLQMLVENAVKHGLDNIQKGGLLSVIATEDGDTLILSIANDLPKKKINLADNIGIGLQNIEQRLKLLYGEHASFTQTKSETQFIAEIRLPKETEQ